LIIFIQLSYAGCEVFVRDGAAYPFTSEFNSSEQYIDMNVKKYGKNYWNTAEGKKLYNSERELFTRSKCKTCCKVLFVSDYNFQEKRRFTAEDDKKPKTYIRYTMDMEFDDLRGVRGTQTSGPGGLEQNILLRPLQEGRDLQFFEFGEFNMYKCYMIPKRVHDIRGGSKTGATLIIWINKQELGLSFDNQQFVFVHNYTSLHFYDNSNKLWTPFPNHFFLPYSSSASRLLCYAAAVPKDKVCTDKVFERETWGGNYNLKVNWLETLGNPKQPKNVDTSYQIIADKCVASDPKQIFVPVFY